jgi:hypothetical protein
MNSIKTANHSHHNHFYHHLVVATVLALVVAIFEHHELLNWLDTISLRVSLAIKSESGQIAPSELELTSNRVGVLLIGGDAFESEFKQETPLSRIVLAKLLKKIADRKSSVIAIDFDLSPGPDGALSNDGQDALDKTLMSIAQSGHTQPVLVNPFPVNDDLLLQKKFDWMHKLCLSGVRFAYPQIHLSQGIALRFPREVLSLGVVANESIKDEKKTSSNPEDPCALISHGIDKALFLSNLADPFVQQRSTDFGAMLPIDPDAIDRVVASVKTWTGDPNDNFESIKPGDVTFIGASYDPRDLFLTLQGAQPGVVFHAACADTLRAPSRPLAHSYAFIFDILLGVTAGYLFGWGWSKYNRASHAYITKLGNPWVLYLRAKGWLIANLIILVGWLLAIFALSALLLRAQLWASPAAMILGVFVKTLLASRHGAFEGHSFSGDKNASTELEFQSSWSIIKWTDFILSSPVLLYGAYLVFFTH